MWLILSLFQGQLGVTSMVEPPQKICQDFSHNHKQNHIGLNAMNTCDFVFLGPQALRY